MFGYLKTNQILTMSSCGNPDDAACMSKRDYQRWVNEIYDGKSYKAIMNVDPYAENVYELYSVCFECYECYDHCYLCDRVMLDDWVNLKKQQSVCRYCIDDDSNINWEDCGSDNNYVTRFVNNDFDSSSEEEQKLKRCIQHKIENFAAKEKIKKQMKHSKKLKQQKDLRQKMILELRRQIPIISVEQSKKIINGLCDSQQYSVGRLEDILSYIQHDFAEFMYIAITDKDF